MARALDASNYELFIDRFWRGHVQHQSRARGIRGLTRDNVSRLSHEFLFMEEILIFQKLQGQIFRSERSASFCVSFGVFKILLKV